MSNKQCRPNHADAALCGNRSESTLFAQAYHIKAYKL